MTTRSGRMYEPMGGDQDSEPDEAPGAEEDAQPAVAEQRSSRFRKRARFPSRSSSLSATFAPIAGQVIMPTKVPSASIATVHMMQSGAVRKHRPPCSQPYR